MRARVAPSPRGRHAEDATGLRHPAASLHATWCIAWISAYRRRYIPHDRGGLAPVAMLIRQKTVKCLRVSTSPEALGYARDDLYTSERVNYIQEHELFANG